jgi:hypothetical protein
MEATLSILEAAGAELAYDEIEIGEKVYLAGNTAGISPEAWDTIRRNKVFLKAPITTPQGGGYKSLNVSTRKFLGLYANIRPCFSLHPYVSTKHPKMDLVIIRENEEDLYAGIEHQQTDEVTQCLKLISRPGCEKIVRYAFEYAKLYGRKKVTCFTKDNIMKQTDGLFREVYNEIAAEYPEIANDHWIIDIGAAKLANAPQDFEVIVTLNLYGDIISDIAAEIAVYLRQIAREYGGNQVCTVGKIDLQPNLINVVPKSATLTLDVRNTDEEILCEVEVRIAKKIAELADAEGVTISSRVLARFEPVEFDEQLTGLIVDLANHHNRSVMLMPSGAGHDAQMLARVCPTTMIFTPSVQGISHNPAEFTNTDDLVAGTNILMDTMWALAHSDLSSQTGMN